MLKACDLGALWHLCQLYHCRTHSLETLSQAFQWSEGETHTIDETTASDHQGDFWLLVLVLVIINSLS